MRITMIDPDGNDADMLDRLRGVAITITRHDAAETTGQLTSATGQSVNILTGDAPFKYIAEIPHNDIAHIDID